MPRNLQSKAMRNFSSYPCYLSQKFGQDNEFNNFSIKSRIIKLNNQKIKLINPLR